MPLFKHFVITLFNLAIWPKDKAGIDTCTPEWLEGRFNLFEKYCIPSIKAQTEKQFIWLCLFDIDTPEIYKNRIKEYQKNISQLRPLFLTKNEASQFIADDLQQRCAFLRHTIKASITKDDEFVITTNIDNDDAVETSFIKRIQQNFLSDPKEGLLSMNSGLQYFPKSKIIIRMSYPHNHFMTLIERADNDIKTIKFYKHAKISKIYKTINISERPYWVEIIHCHNVNNDIRITSRIHYYAIISNYSLKNYGLNISMTWKRNLFNTLFILPVYFLKIALRKLYKKITKKH